MRFAPMETLLTRRLLLRKLTMEDAPVFFARLGSSEKVTEHMLWVPHRDISESVGSIQKVLQRYETGKCYRWGITLRGSGELIGIIELLGFEESAGTCSFAYMLGEDFWGQGYGTEAVGAAFRFAFSKLEISTINADHFAENPASGAVMRKAGMTRLGIVPGKYKKNGVFHDAVQYRITKEDWNIRETEREAKHDQIPVP